MIHHNNGCKMNIALPYFYVLSRENTIPQFLVNVCVLRYTPRSTFIMNDMCFFRVISRSISTSQNEDKLVLPDH